MESAELFSYLQEKGMDFYAGVPDSLLKDFCAYVKDNVDGSNHIVTANEGNAIAIAAGYHLATGKSGIVYLQNSGLGNCVNPITSLVDKDIYAIPLLLIVGWRGEPGHKDEPQHVVQGRITPAMLEVLGIKYSILPSQFNDSKVVIDDLLESMKIHPAPHALLIRKGTFNEYKLKTPLPKQFILSREEAIETVVSKIGQDGVIVSTTGMASRELFEIRERRRQGHEKDFLTVGSMGHASSIALGIALHGSKKVYCFDGDGAMIMHMGAMATIGKLAPKKLCHIILNNITHDSVGGQPTAADAISLPDIAVACSYTKALSATSLEDIKQCFDDLSHCDGPTLLEIKINSGHRTDLGRPTRTPMQNKEDFIGFLQGRK